jgi:hypothetical protein
VLRVLVMSQQERFFFNQTVAAHATIAANISKLERLVSDEAWRAFTAAAPWLFDDAYRGYCDQAEAGEPDTMRHPAMQLQHTLKRRRVEKESEAASHRQSDASLVAASPTWLWSDQTEDSRHGIRRASGLWFPRPMHAQHFRCAAPEPTTVPVTTTSDASLNRRDPGLFGATGLPPVPMQGGDNSEVKRALVKGAAVHAMRVLRRASAYATCSVPGLVDAMHESKDGADSTTAGDQGVRRGESGAAAVRSGLPTNRMAASLLAKAAAATDVRSKLHIMVCANCHDAVALEERAMNRAAEVGAAVSQEALVMSVRAAPLLAAVACASKSGLTWLAEASAAARATVNERPPCAVHIDATITTVPVFATHVAAAARFVKVQAEVQDR